MYDTIKPIKEGKLFVTRIPLSSTEGLILGDFILRFIECSLLGDRYGYSNDFYVEGTFNLESVSCNNFTEQKISLEPVELCNLVPYEEYISDMPFMKYPIGTVVKRLSDNTHHRVESYFEHELLRKHNSQKYNISCISEGCNSKDVSSLLLDSYIPVKCM